jgi:transcriptional regulator NrdR family protein
MSHVVKRGVNRIEPYRSEKLHLSIQSACLSVRTFEGEAETTAREVCKAVERWLEDRLEVTSSDIRRKAAEALNIYNPEAAIVYKEEKELA